MTGTVRNRNRAGLVVAVLLWLILSATYALFSPAIDGPFLFDDHPNLSNLSRIGDEISWDSLSRYLSAWQGSPGRPLAALSFLIEDHAWPSDPGAFKRNNIFWHLLVGIGIFALVRSLLACWRECYASDIAPLRLDLIALAACAFWLIHPLHVSTLFLVVQRMAILANGLMILGLLLYLRVLRHSADRDAKAALRALAPLPIFGGIAFLAKENGPLIFAYATAINLTLGSVLVSRFTPNGRLLLWAGTAGTTGLLILALLWQVRDPVAAFASRDFDLIQRVLSQTRILWDYLFSIMMPRLSGAGIYHDDYSFSTSLLTPVTTIIALAGISLTTIAAFIYRKKWPLASFAVLWFLAGHLIESTVLPLELVFEHRNYLAMLGPITAATVALLAFGSKHARYFHAFFLLWLLVTGTISFLNARQWGNGLELAAAWEHERPQSVRAAQSLAAEFEERGDYGSAHAVLVNAHERIPKADELLFQIALLDCFYGLADKSTFERLNVHAVTSRRARIVFDVVESLRKQIDSRYCGQAVDFQVVDDLLHTLLANPQYAESRSARAFLNWQRALLRLDAGQLAAAIPYFERAFEDKPEPQTAVNIAQILLALDRPEEALLALEHAENAEQPPFESWLNATGPQVERLRAAAQTMLKQSANREKE